jgi:hypothetical protein
MSVVVQCENMAEIMALAELWNYKSYLQTPSLLPVCDDGEHVMNANAITSPKVSAADWTRGNCDF